MARTTEIQQQYEQALDSLVAKVQRDHWIIAAILLGSLSYDVVWEKSDIDLLLVREEGKQKSGGSSLLEGGIKLPPLMRAPRERSKMMEGPPPSSFLHSAALS